MARENEAKFIGIIDNIEKDNVNQVSQIKLRVIRRNGRIDAPILLILPEHYDMVSGVEVGDTVIAKGFLATMNTERSYKCINCGKSHSETSIVSNIIAIYIKKIEGVYNLEDFREVSNSITLLGPLCRNVKIKELRSGIKNAQYQMAIARKIRVEGQEDIVTDFPFVSSLDEQAEEDYKRMEEGSQCWINGGIQTRDIVKEFICDQCGERNSLRQTIMEVCPYNVEYLYNCNFEEE